LLGHVEVEQGRYQLSSGQITRSPKNYEHLIIGLFHSVLWFLADCAPSTPLLAKGVIIFEHDEYKVYFRFLIEETTTFGLS
jgi:hypothetical protein